ncbi:type VI secretion system membrane subunit TssM [Xanthobacter sp. DSM 24535]|uniref:type VI secretion system membrane subunit TssM n=1 Tax=Roseixanthobacter psychrophilus TaxID=3119917 RepID=UPI00372A60C9
MVKMLTSRAFWRWVVLIVVAVLLAAAIWFLAPLVSIGGDAPMADATPRVLALLVLLLLCVLIVLSWRTRPEPAGPAAEHKALLPAGVVPARDAQVEAQTAALADGFQRAMGVLRRMRLSHRWGRSYAYQLPWYLVTGMGGAGKTSLIRRSGLRFPVADRRDGPGGQIAAGASCAFFFSDAAVLVDTQGPFRGDGIASGSERQVWTNFVALLKKHRPRQPINGVILAINLEDLEGWSEAERLTHGADIRQQLVGLQTRLKVRFPVYVVLTKADRVPGFHAFFDGITAEERNRVFGLTFPLCDENGLSAEGETLFAFLNREYDNLLQWQLPRVLNRVNLEADAGRRFDTFMFLPYLAALKPAVCDLLEDMFKPSGYERPLLLRGLYLTSADAEEVGNESPYRLLPQERPEGGSAVVERRRTGFFIHDTLEKVIFGEAGLVGIDSELKRRQKHLQWGLTALAGCIAVGLGLWWTVSFLGNRALIEQVDRSADRARQVIAPLGESAVLKPGGDADLSVAVPALTTLAAMPTGWNDRSQSVPLAHTAGLSQTPRLATATRTEYTDALQSLFLPRLDLALQRQIEANMSKPSTLYGELMVYLMFGGVAPMDKELVVAWMRREWATTYPGPAQAPLRAALVTQLSNLIDARFPKLDLNASLVARARAVLNQYPAAERGLSILEDLPEVKELQPWSVADAAGPLAPYALVRRSGKTLADGIAGMYTAANFFTVVLPAISKVAEALVREDWVRTPANPNTPAAVRASQLKKDMLALYTSDYVAQWEALLSDITIAPFATLQQEMAVLQALIGPPSPLKVYLTAVAQQTTLAPPAKPVNVADASAAKAELASLLGGGPSPGQPVTDRFAGLHTFVTGTPSPIDDVVKALTQLRMAIGPAASAGDASPSQVTELTSGPAFSQILGQLRMSTLSAPPALAESILALVRQTSAITNAGVREDMNAAWKAQVLPFCQVAINGRYPFENSQNEATLVDFTRMFAPGGLLDQFFEKQLKPFVDTSVAPWKLLANAGARPDITAPALAYFEQAARIRTMFFPAGATAPQLTFDVTPTNLDPGAMRVKLEIDGQSIIYQYGPPQALAVKWPGASGIMRVEFGAQESGQPSSLTVNGPWALFRFLNARGLTRITANRFAFNINLGPRAASFTLDAASVNNPFRQNPLTSFKCLPSLVPG